MEESEGKRKINKACVRVPMCTQGGEGENGKGRPRESVFGGEFPDSRLACWGFPA